MTRPLRWRWLIEMAGYSAGGSRRQSGQPVPQLANPSEQGMCALASLYSTVTAGQVPRPRVAQSCRGDLPSRHHLESRRRRLSRRHDPCPPPIGLLGERTPPAGRGSQDSGSRDESYSERARRRTWRIRPARQEHGRRRGRPAGANPPHRGRFHDAAHDRELSRGTVVTRPPPIDIR